MEISLFIVFTPLWYGLQIFLLWLFADFLTGTIHWWEDTYGNPSWPILGKSVVLPNLEHHQNPRSLLAGSYWNRINTSLYAAIVVGVLLWLCGWHSWRMIVCLVFASQGNEIHAVAHRTDKENGKFLMFLQKIGIVQKRKTHGWHHQAPYNTNFCVMTEFMNPILNAINFWVKVEWVLLKVFRIKVLRGSEIRKGI